MFGQAGAAALDLVGPGANGWNAEERGEAEGADDEGQPASDESRGVSEHGSDLQLEGFVQGDIGCRLAAVVDDAPVLRRSARGIVFRAEGARAAVPAAHFQIGAPRGPAVGTG
ncbi:hypothetical protein D9M69_672010 [compost metagenome]